MSQPTPTRRLLALLPLALLLFAPATAMAADTYESSWNGGHLTATANADLTEATIESVSVSFDECGTNSKETSCAWEAIATLHSRPESRCNPATPEDQVVWESGLQPGNGTVEDGPVSFPLEGCRGQALVFEVAGEKTYSEGPISWSRSGSVWTLLTFGYHPREEAETRIIENNPPASLPPFEPNFTPKTFTPDPDCRTVQLESARYAFAFGRMGCYRATNLGRMRYRTGQAPRGFNCRRLGGEGVRCWRRNEPAKFFEWHLPRPRS